MMQNGIAPETNGKLILSGGDQKRPTFWKLLLGAL